MASLNGNLRLLGIVVGVVAALGGAAVGYGTLKADVRTNTEAIVELRAEVREAKTNIGASAAGASLQAQIRAIDQRLDRIEAQNVRIEGQNAEILRLLSRTRSSE